MSPRSAPSPTPRRVLVALTPADLEQFFPGGFRLPKCEIELHTPIDARTLSVACRKFRPQALVTGWSTPRVSYSSTTAGGGSVAYVCHLTGTVRQLISDKMLRDGLLVTNWGSLIAPQVAEHALLLILGALRAFHSWRHVFADKWEDRMKIKTRTLHGKSIGVYGFGAIAQELIRLLKPFHVKVEVYSAKIPEQLIRNAGAAPVTSLEAVTRGKDIFVCCEALTSTTRHSVTPGVLAGLMDEAVVCNVGRGALVDEKHWWPLVRTKRFRLAADVFEQEPLPADSPWREHREAFLSPHIGGPTRDSYPECGNFALLNLRRYFAGRPLKSQVTPAVFARST